MNNTMARGAYNVHVLHTPLLGSGEIESVSTGCRDTVS